jgi:hypothetical protein
LYSNLRFVISASLVGCAGLIAVLALLPATFEERLLASEEVSAQPCSEHTWWHFDRNCLSRRGMPWAAEPTGTVPSAAESAPEQAVIETQSSPSAAEGMANATEATAPPPDAAAPPVIAQEPAPAMQRSDVTAPQKEASAPPVATEPPLASEPPPVTAERHIPKQRTEHSRHAVPVAPQAHEKRRVATPAVEPQTRAAAAKKAAEPQTPAAAPKKTVREDRGAKQADEALNAVRKFQDNLRDIPVSSYAGDGTRRTIMIRPTSIQDVYYYSAPR